VVLGAFPITQNERRVTAFRQHAHVFKGDEGVKGVEVLLNSLTAQQRMSYEAFNARFDPDPDP
jgi:hypothetical protein